MEDRKQGQEGTQFGGCTSVHHGGHSCRFHCLLQAPHPALCLAASSPKLLASQNTALLAFGLSLAVQPRPSTVSTDGRSVPPHCWKETFKGERPHPISSFPRRNPRLETGGWLKPWGGEVCVKSI